ncbi:phage portal protein [Glutamicibacter arilaitensis]|uniref:phage portal protein n=2 Tax=Glutamicibacter arilaitensis TaxID=256701 RepID=UPI003F912DD9
MHEYVMANFGGSPSVAQATESSVIGLAKAALDTLSDEAETLEMIYDYCRGAHLKPFAPRDTTDEIRDTQRRSITNLVPLVTSHPSQVLRVEGYRRGTFGDPDKISDDDLRFPKEWQHWQRNRLDARQHLIYETALKYGRAMVLVDNITTERTRVDVLPARRTIPFFRDPANDVRPEAVVIVRSLVSKTGDPGLIHVWTDTGFYQILFDDKKPDGGEFIVAADPVPHGADGCPAVRYHCFLDDEGSVEGVVERVIASQDRLNQSVFDTNILSSHGSFKVRTAAGLTPSYELDDQGQLKLDSNGHPIPIPIKVSQARMLISDKPDTKFGQLDETPLDGHLAAEDTAMRNMAITGQLPPHVFLGNLSNLSAEALDAAEVSFRRFVEYLQAVFSDSHEELLRIICELEGDDEGAASYGGEVRWGDIGQRSFAAWMDGLAKGVESLQLPREGAWSLMPGVSSQQIMAWRAMREKELKDDLARPGTDFENGAIREMGPPVVTNSDSGGARLGSIY